MKSRMADSLVCPCRFAQASTALLISNGSFAPTSAILAVDSTLRGNSLAGIATCHVQAQYPAGRLSA